jgi:hypothetical protein
VRPRAEDGWQQRALLPDPTADELRAAEGGRDVAPQYLDDTNVDPRVAEIAAQITADADNGFDRAMALQDHFTGPTSQFTYSLETAPGSGGDALVEFLTIGRTGYCEQYASAMAAMLRTVDVPARVAVGFTAGTELADHRSVSTEDAHAWVEAWFPGIGWTTFDPTPLTDGRAVTPPYVEEARGQAPGADTAAQPDDLSAQDQAEIPVPAPLPEIEQAPTSTETPSDAGPGLAPLWPVLPLLLVAALLGTPAGLRVLDRRRRLTAVHAGGPGAAPAAWAELLAASTDRGVPAPSTDTVRGSARRLVREHRLDATAQQSLRVVVTAVEASVYGVDHPAAGELDGPVRAVAAAVAAGSALTLRQRLLPQSVLHRLRAGRARALQWRPGRPRRQPAATGERDREPVGVG